MDSVALGHRVFLAHLEAERRLQKRISYDEFGALVAEEEGRAEAYSGGNVFRWEKGKKTPGLGALQAIARLAGLPAGYVAFGEMGPMMAREEGALAAAAEMNGGTPNGGAREVREARGPRELPASHGRRVAGGAKKKAPPNGTGKGGRTSPRGSRGAEGRR